MCSIHSASSTSSRRSPLHILHCLNLSLLQQREWKDCRVQISRRKHKHTERAVKRAARSRSVRTRGAYHALKALLLPMRSCNGRFLSLRSATLYILISSHFLSCLHQFHCAFELTLIARIDLGLTMTSTNLSTGHHRKHLGTSSTEPRTLPSRRRACKADADHRLPSSKRNSAPVEPKHRPAGDLS